MKTDTAELYNYIILSSDTNKKPGMRWMAPMTFLLLYLNFVIIYLTESTSKSFFKKKQKTKKKTKRSKKTNPCKLQRKFHTITILKIKFSLLFSANENFLTEFQLNVLIRLKILLRA